MFPTHYFADRYFAPRYFPKVGGLLPPTLGDIRVLVRGIDRTDYVAYRDSTTWSRLQNSRGTASIPFVLALGETFLPMVWDRIELYDPFETRVWAGYVLDVKQRWLGDDGWSIRTVQAVSLEAFLEGMAVDRVQFANETVGDIISTLFGYAVALGLSGVTLGDVSDGPTVETLEVSNIGQGISQACTFGGFIWYIDPRTGTLNAHSPAFRDPSFTINSGEVLWETSEWEQNASNYRDSQQVQLTAPAQAPITESFSGDDSTTVFTLSQVPSYILAVEISIGSTDRTISWTPGSADVSITPALPTGVGVNIRYVKLTSAAATVPLQAVGKRTFIFTRSRTFTSSGAEQEAAAIVAMFSLLPAQCTLSTYKPGAGVGDCITINLTDPVNAGERLNGQWIVQEVEGAIVPGLDQRDEPFGHFRYGLHLVSKDAFAIFHGDGSTTEFTLPEIPADVSSITIGDDGSYSKSWVEGEGFCTVTPPPPLDVPVEVKYAPGSSRAPVVPTYVQEWTDALDKGSKDVAAQADGTETNIPNDFYLRTLLLKDTSVGDDIADHATVYADGMAFQIQGVLRKTQTGDLTVRFRKVGLDTVTILDLITVTIESSTPADETVVFDLLTGSPPVKVPFLKGEVLIADVLSSDGQPTDAAGIAAFDVIWTRE